MEKYHDPRLADRIFELAWTHSHVLLRQLNVTEAERRYMVDWRVRWFTLRRCAGPTPAILARNRRGQSGLWGYGISGDLPIVLVRIRDRSKYRTRSPDDAGPCILADEGTGGRSGDLERRRLGLSAESAGHDHGAWSPPAPRRRWSIKPGGIFVRRGEQMSEEDRVLLQTVARVVLFDEAGTLVEQVRAARPCGCPHPRVQTSRRSVCGSLPLPKCRCATWSFSTSWAVSVPTAKSMYDFVGGSDDARPLVQRDRESRIRNRRLRKRRSIHLVRKQSRIPAYPLAQ